MACFWYIWLLQAEMCFLINYIQLSFNDSNTDDSFTMADSNWFFSPNESLPMAQANNI